MLHKSILTSDCNYLAEDAVTDSQSKDKLQTFFQETATIFEFTFRRTKYTT